MLQKKQHQQFNAVYSLIVVLNQELVTKKNIEFRPHPQPLYLENLKQKKLKG